MQKDNLIVTLTFQFALDIIVFTEQLEKNKKYNLANQLFRSGTSIGANVREAQGCESKADFIHKMKVAYKEAEETSYWLELCLSRNIYKSRQAFRGYYFYSKGARQNYLVIKKLICISANLHICTSL